MNKKIVIGLVALMTIFVLVGCDNHYVSNENINENDSPISDSNSGNNINSEVNESIKNNQNIENDNLFNLNDEEVISLLELDFSDTMSIKDISVNNEGTYITFSEKYGNTETQVKITGFEGKVKSMKYMMVPQLVMYGDLLLLSDQGEVYITEKHLIDEKEETIVKEFVMKKLETSYQVESIAGYEFGSHINLPVLKYENGTFAEIELGTNEISKLNKLRDCLVKDLFCKEYQVIELLKNNEKIQELDKYNYRLLIGCTSAENDFGMNIISNDTDEIFYTTGETDISIDFENKLLKIPDEFYNNSDINFERFEFEVDNDSLDISIKAFISDNEDIVIIFK